jgi:hypothetical protein
LYNLIQHTKKQDFNRHSKTKKKLIEEVFFFLEEETKKNLWKNQLTHPLKLENGIGFEKKMFRSKKKNSVSKPSGLF